MSYENLFLRNGQKIYVSGILLLLILAFLIILHIFMYIPPSAGFFVFLCVLLLGGVMIIFSGSAYSNLSRIGAVLGGYTLERADTLRLTVTVKDQEREFTILYHALAAPYSFWVYISHSLLTTLEIPPEHYQIWTSLKGSSPARRNRYDFIKYVRPSGAKRFFSMTSSRKGECVFDEYVMALNGNLHRKAKEISSLRYMGVAREQNELIVAAFLTQVASIQEIGETLTIMKEICHQVES
jgi:hypothetical protein